MAKNAEDVQRALLSERLRIDDFMALLSPAADPFIEKMALKSHRLTRQRFGNTILIFVRSTSPTPVATAAATAVSTLRTARTGKLSPLMRSSGKQR
jgi:hypothetical protein